MSVLITGADGALALDVARNLTPRHGLRLTGRTPRPDSLDDGLDYRQADLRDEATVGELMDGIDAIVHLALFDPPPWEGADAEKQLLEYATRGTYILCQEARRAAVERIVVVGSLRVFDAYPEHHRVDEAWMPRPEPTAEGLAPYLCEQSVREFAREGPIRCICLRFLPIGDDPERNTSLADALHAIDGALGLGSGHHGYRWLVFHVARHRRYSMHEAIHHLGLGREVQP